MEDKFLVKFSVDDFNEAWFIPVWRNVLLPSFNSKVFLFALDVVRYSRKVSFERMSDEVGISKGTLGYLFNGDSVPSASQFIKLVFWLKMDWQTFFLPKNELTLNFILEDLKNKLV